MVNGGHECGAILNTTWCLRVCGRGSGIVTMDQLAVAVCGIVCDSVTRTIYMHARNVFSDTTRTLIIIYQQVWPQPGILVDNVLFATIFVVYCHKEMVRRDDKIRSILNVFVLF